jgi:thymidine kinase
LILATINCRGFTPYKHQKDVIDELKNAKGTGKRVIVLSSRQKGKSFMIANLLLYYALNNNKVKCFCVSPTLKQSKAIYSTIFDAVENSGIVKKANAADYEIRFINGSAIYFKSAEQDEALRGYTADFLCIDECCFITDEVFYKIAPWADAKQAPVLMVSTPFVKEGFFWNFYNYGLEKQNNTVTINWSDNIYKEDIQKILPPEKLEEYRRVFPKNQFKTEYLGEWLDNEGVVFDNFKNCVKNNKINTYEQLFVGIDWASGVEADETVISILNSKGEQLYIDGFNNINTTQTIDRLMSVINPHLHQIVSITPETNSIGKPFTDLLTERLPQTQRHKVQGFTTSNTSKGELVSDLQVAFQEGNISILDDEKQLRQLSVYSAEYNPKTKVVTYNAPRGLHDDRVMALMLSYRGYKNKQTTGYYCLGNSKLGRR